MLPRPLLLAGAFLTASAALQAQHIELQPAGGGNTAVFSPVAGDTALSLTSSRTIRFKPGNGGFSVGAPGSERLFVSNSGNVGIGTATPQAPLQIGDHTFHFFVNTGSDKFSINAYNAYWNGSSLTRLNTGASSMIFQGENNLNEPVFNFYQYPSGTGGGSFSPGAALHKFTFEGGRFAINRDNGAAGLHIESPDNQALYLDIATDGSRPELRIFGTVAASAGIKASSTMPGSYTLTLPDDAGTNGQLLRTDGSGFLTWVDPAGTQTFIQDADANTSVQTEKSANEDIIRFNIAGNERMALRQNGAGGSMLEFPAGSILIGNSAGLSNTAGNNVFIGSSSGNANTSGNQNVYLGHEAGSMGTTAARNAFTGFRAGLATTTGSQNTFFGSEAGRDNTSADNNTFIGAEAGRENTAKENTFIGATAGTANLTGEGNVFVGYASGYLHGSGNNNVLVGKSAGLNNTSGSGNVFIGNQAGENETGSNKLYIDNSNTTTPLIKGDFTNDKLILNADVTTNGSTSANDFTYSSAKTHFLSVPGAAFHGMEATTNIVMNNGGGAFQPYVYLNGTANRAIAPVYLPDGATITGITMYFEDQVGASVTAMDMMVLNNTNATTAGGPYYNGGISGNTLGVSSVNAVFSYAVDNINNSYCLMWTPGTLNSGVRLYRAIVAYTVSKPD